jgi:hypothetical protein
VQASLRPTPVPTVVLPKLPTAQQLADERQVAASSWLPAPVLVPSGLGVAVLVHVFPFQCRISLRFLPGGLVLP